MYCMLPFQQNIDHIHMLFGKWIQYLHYRKYCVRAYALFPECLPFRNRATGSSQTTAALPKPTNSNTPKNLDCEKFLFFSKTTQSAVLQKPFQMVSRSPEKISPGRRKPMASPGRQSFTATPVAPRKNSRHAPALGGGMHQAATAAPGQSLSVNSRSREESYRCKLVSREKSPGGYYAALHELLVAAHSIGERISCGGGPCIIQPPARACSLMQPRDLSGRVRRSSSPAWESSVCVYACVCALAMNLSSLPFIVRGILKKKGLGLADAYYLLDCFWWARLLAGQITRGFRESFFDRVLTREVICGLWELNASYVLCEKGLKDSAICFNEGDLEWDNFGFRLNLLGVRDFPTAQ